MGDHIGVDELRVWLRFGYAFPQGPSDDSISAYEGGLSRSQVAAAESQATFRGILDVECPYSQRHYEASFALRPWWSVTRAACWLGHAPAQLQIMEYEPIEWDDVLKEPFVVTNNLMVRKGFCRKANFAIQMRRHVQKCGPKCPLAAGIPDSAVIDTVPVFHDRPKWLDFAAAMADALSDADDMMSRNRDDGATLWILKPSLANKAAEICIVRSVEEVEAALRTWRDIGQWVLQRYVEKPLLVGGGRKFHLRVYALANGALDAYVFSEALVLMAVEPFAQSANDTSARHSHITNTCVGTEHGGFLEERFVRTLSELPQLLVDEGAVADVAEGAKRVAALTEGIHASVAHAFDAFYGGMHGYQALPNAFELYGLDFLVDTDWQLYLLEANPTPDIKQTGSRLDPVISDLIEGTVRVAVDSRFPPPAGVTPPSASPLARDWVRVYGKAWPATR